MWFKIYLFFTKSIKIMTSFHKKYWSHRKNFPRNIFGYGTVYLELLILIFQSLTNYFEDFTEGSPMDIPQPIKPQKSLALVVLNFECLLKPFNWFALHCKWHDEFLHDTSFYWKVLPNRLFIVKLRGFEFHIPYIPSR